MGSHSSCAAGSGWPDLARRKQGTCRACEIVGHQGHRRCSLGGQRSSQGVEGSADQATTGGGGAAPGSDSSSRRYGSPRRNALRGAVHHFGARTMAAADADRYPSAICMYIYI